MDTLIEKLDSMAFETDCDGKVRPFKVVEWDDIIQIVGQSQQMSVSLERCAHAVHDNMIEQRKSMKEDYLFFNVTDITKAVLDSVKEQGVNIKYQQNIRPPEIEK